MSDDVFADPDESREEWVDVRMTDPQRGEWDVDAVVVGGQFEYVDLQIRPELLESFVECLLDDVSAERADGILREVAKRRGIAFPDGASDDSPAESGEQPLD